jgi:hypothetical protein
MEFEEILNQARALKETAEVKIVFAIVRIPGHVVSSRTMMAEITGLFVLHFLTTWTRASAVLRAVMSTAPMFPVLTNMLNR